MDITYFSITTLLHNNFSTRNDVLRPLSLFYAINQENGAEIVFNEPLEGRWDVESSSQCTKNIDPPHRVEGILDIKRVKRHNSTEEIIVALTAAFWTSVI